MNRKVHALEPYKVGLFENNITKCGRLVNKIRDEEDTYVSYPDRAIFIIGEDVTCKTCIRMTQ